MNERGQHGPRRRKDGLARPEWVFLLGLVLLALSIAWPGWVQWKRFDRLNLARSDLMALELACERFYTEYGHWPTAHTGERADVRYGQGLPNAEVINVLRGMDGPGNVGNRVNPNRRVFLDIPPAEDGLSGIDEQGEFRDPWGKPYQMLLDANLNNVISATNTIYNNFVGEGFVAWSSGPDGISDNGDDIRSWELAH